MCVCLWMCVCVYAWVFVGVCVCVRVCVSDQLGKNRPVIALKTTHFFRGQCISGVF